MTRGLALQPEVLYKRMTGASMRQDRFQTYPDASSFVYTALPVATQDHASLCKPALTGTGGGKFSAKGCTALCRKFAIPLVTDNTPHQQIHHAYSSHD